MQHLSSFVLYLTASSQVGRRAFTMSTRRTTTTRASAIKREATGMASASTNKNKGKNPKASPPVKKAKPSPKPKSQKSSSSNTETAQVPWYHVFTKGGADYNQYMREEWSFEKRGDQALFEKVCLEGSQSGLSWQTILRKREAYRKTFHNFDPHKVAKMTSDDLERILNSQGDARETVVRHRGKLEAVINNAKCLLEMQKETGDSETALDTFLWAFVDDKPILNRWGESFNPYDYGSLKQSPSQSTESQAMSKALKQKGWKFVGPTTCYALMQSSGMIIDHPVCAPEWEQARQRLLSRPGGFQERDSTK
uniref:DNA-3-methyladenine glycosylase I n=1 Tax=Amphora coffeiformis TaxID=265554 RepID=A0A7S3KXX2_9STRA